MRTLLILSVLLTLSACAKPTAGVGTETTCLVWRPVSWSSKDTDRTITEVKGNNARQKAFCEE